MTDRAGDPHDRGAAAEARRTWRAFVVAIRGVGNEFGVGNMGRCAINCLTVDFPVDGESARLTASALIRLADAYRTAAIDGRRYHIGRALEATASAVDGLLDEHLQAAADVARLRFGERD